MERGQYDLCFFEKKNECVCWTYLESFQFCDALLQLFFHFFFSSSFVLKLSTILSDLSSMPDVLVSEFQEVVGPLR